MKQFVTIVTSAGPTEVALSDPKRIFSVRHREGRKYIVCPEGFSDYFFDSDAACDKALKLIRDARDGRDNWQGGLRTYLAKHQDIFYTIAFVAALDALLFGGALRHRIQGVIESFMAKVEAEA